MIVAIVAWAMRKSSLTFVVEGATVRIYIYLCVANKCSLLLVSGVWSEDRSGLQQSHIAGNNDTIVKQIVMAITIVLSSLGKFMSNKHKRSQLVVCKGVP